MNADAGLKDRVAVLEAAPVRADLRAVQDVGQRPDHLLAEVPNGSCVSASSVMTNWMSETPFRPRSGEGSPRSSSTWSPSHRRREVELHQLAAFPLPPHPDLLDGVPATAAMEQIERVVLLAVPLVEGADPLDRPATRSASRGDSRHRRR